MNELEQTLQKILERSLEVAEQTGQFAMEQAPEILEQFFAWHLASHVMGVVFGCMFAGICIWVIWADFKYNWENIGKIFGGIMMVLPLIIICANIYEIVFILVAPKIYLIEYFVK